MGRSWDEALRRIAAGEDIEAVLEEKAAHEVADFVAYLRSEGKTDAADRYLAKVREINSGVYGARNTWHSISPAQRRVLLEVNEHGGRVERVGKQYRHRSQNHKPIYAATIRNLCTRDLMAWDGGIFDPEAIAVLTERGWFVIRHGQTT